MIVSVILNQTQTMIFCLYKRDCRYKNTTEIYSRRGAESAKVTSVIFFQSENIILSIILSVLCASAREHASILCFLWPNHVNLTKDHGLSRKDTVFRLDPDYYA